MSIEAMKQALELLAVATFHSPELQAKRTEVIERGLQAIAEADKQEPSMKGCKMVPIEPTKEMIDAACQDGICVEGRPVWKHSVAFQAKWKWQQMLSALPAQPKAEGEHALERALTRLQKRYSELEAKVAAQPKREPLTDELLSALDRIVKTVPAQDGNGGFIVDHHDMDGEYLGTQQIDPMWVVQEMAAIAHNALEAHGIKGEA